MAVLNWLKRELGALLLAMLYFGACFIVIELLKHLMLEGYGIAFSGLATALALAFITAKVVVVLDKAPLGHRIGLVEAALRTALYSAAAFALRLLEKAVSTRGEAGGVLPALAGVLDHPDMPKIWAALVCVGFAFFGYTVFAVIRRSMGAARLRAALLGEGAAAAAGET